MQKLNVKTKTIKVFEGNIGVNLHSLALGNCFLNMTPNTHAAKEKKRQTRLIKMKIYVL